MSLPSAPAPPGGLGARFFLVGYLPTYTALMFLLILIWADGGPGTSFKRAWKIAGALTATQIILIVLAVFLLGLLLVPFQLWLVRLVEGSWPDRWATRRVGRHRKRRDELEIAAIPTSSADAEILRAGLAGQRLRERYPLPRDLVRATALGNVLAAMEDRAGRDYGLDAVVAWPRLYPLLKPATKAIVDDRRDTMDYSVRLSVTAALTALGSLIILFGAWRWMLLALIPAAVAWLAYLGAVQAALAYGESVQAAFDTHHITFGEAFGLPRPSDPKKEREMYGELCDLWRQSIPPGYTYAIRPADVSLEIGANP